MKLNFRSEKGKLTEAMKQYAEEKTSKLTKYIKDQEELKGNLVWKINGPKQVVEITIPLKGFVLRVEESGEDFYSIIDLSIDKLERQIRKNKTRIEKQINKTKIDFDYFEEIEDEEDFEDYSDEEYTPEGALLGKITLNLAKEEITKDINSKEIITSAYKYEDISITTAKFSKTCF